MMKFAVKIFSFIFILRNYTYAMDIEDLKHKYVEMIMECAKDNPIGASDVTQLKNKQMPENAKCLFACAYKKSGMMDDQGMMSVEGVNQIAQKYLSSDPETLQKAEEFTDACKSVNDEAVSDGSKGCERAALIFKCSIDKAPQFNFAI